MQMNIKYLIFTHLQRSEQTETINLDHTVLVENKQLLSVVKSHGKTQRFNGTVTELLSENLSV